MKKDITYVKAELIRVKKYLEKFPDDISAISKKIRLEEILKKNC